MKEIKVYEYSPEWLRIFEQEAASLRTILGAHCLHIHHFGSTSVPGLISKENIDILCVVDKLKESLNLQNFNYLFKGELNIPLRYHFSKKTSHSKINLHVVEQDNGFINLNLTFRDYLRTHPEDRKAYGELKQKILEHPQAHTRDKSGFPLYSLAKNSFIKEILEKAGFNDRTLNFCLHNEEWETYHRIRKEQIFSPFGIEYDPNHPSIRADNHFHFILYKGTSIVSVAHIELINETIAALRSLATDEPFKNQGHATYLLSRLEKWIASQNRTTILMHANPEAEHFYRKLRFKDMAFGEPCTFTSYIDLGKTLPKS